MTDRLEEIKKRRETVDNVIEDMNRKGISPWNSGLSHRAAWNKYCLTAPGDIDYLLTEVKKLTKLKVVIDWYSKQKIEIPTDEGIIFDWGKIAQRAIKDYKDD